MFAWHFIKNDYHLAYDLSHIICAEGLLSTVEPPLIAGQRGLHASPSIHQAIVSAPGTVLCRVELSGEVIENSNNGRNTLCAQKRYVHQMMEVSGFLEGLQCRVILEYLKSLENVDISKEARDKVTTCVEAVKAKAQYLRQRVTRDELEKAVAAANNCYVSFLTQKEDLHLIYAALWVFRTCLTEDMLPSCPGRHLVLGTLTSWFSEVNTLPHGNDWIQYFESLCIEGLVKSCPDLKLSLT